MNSTRKGSIIKVAGPLVVATGMKDAKMFEVIGETQSSGEILKVTG